MKRAFINRLAAEGYSKTEAAEIADMFVEEVAAALEENGTAKLPRLGKLVLHEVAARSGRNPMTGAPVDIPARTAVKFRPSKMLHARVQGAPFPPPL